MVITTVVIFITLNRHKLITDCVFYVTLVLTFVIICRRFSVYELIFPFHLHTGVFCLLRRAHE